MGNAYATECESPNNKTCQVLNKIKTLKFNFYFLIKIFNIFKIIKRKTVQNNGRNYLELGCSASCEVGATCCNTTNCNTVSDIVPTKTVKSCYVGTSYEYSDYMSSKTKQACVAPVNGYCQVHFIKCTFL